LLILLSTHQFWFYLLKSLRRWCNLKGLSHEILTPIFFTPIDRPNLGDGQLMGINFGRCGCAEKQAIYALSRMLKRGMNAQFRVKNCSLCGSKFIPTLRACSLRVSMKKMRERASFYYYDYMIKFLLTWQELLYLCLLPC